MFCANTKTQVRFCALAIDFNGMETSFGEGFGRQYVYPYISFAYCKDNKFFVSYRFNFVSKMTVYPLRKVYDIRVYSYSLKVL